MSENKKYPSGHTEIYHDTYIGYCKHCDKFICTPDNVINVCGAESIICPICQKYFDASGNKKNKRAEKKLKRLLSRTGPALINHEVQPIFAIASGWTSDYKGINKKCLNCENFWGYMIYDSCCAKDHEYIADTENEIDCPDFKEFKENNK